MKFHPCKFVALGDQQGRFKCKKTGDFCIAQRYCNLEKEWVPNNCNSNCKYFEDRKQSNIQNSQK